MRRHLKSFLGWLVLASGLYRLCSRHRAVMPLCRRGDCAPARARISCTPGVRSRWMGWDDVRRLRQQGFEFGSHTSSHCDLGRVDRNEAARELTGSRAQLEQELGEPVRLFSYPYGGRDNITVENQDEV